MIVDTSATLSAHESHLSDLDAGVAMALAMANVPIVPGKTFSLGMAAGSYGGEQGYALKLNWMPESNITVSGGVALNSRDETSGAVGVAIGW
jgi:autotransporter adhesin